VDIGQGGGSAGEGRCISGIIAEGYMWECPERACWPRGSLEVIGGQVVRSALECQCIG
jgi:hypothetical protein